MSTPLKILLSLAALVGFSLTIGAAILIYLFAKAPETYVYTGQQMSKSHLETVREMGLLNESEEIQFFYSDAFFDIRKGMYFVTGERLVLYSEEWAEPTLAVPFEAIVDVEADYDPSFFIDSEITITLDDEVVWSFPVSSERGRDKDFYEYIETRMGGNFESGIPAETEEPAGIATTSQ